MGGGLWLQAWKRLKRDRFAKLCLWIILGYFVLAFLVTMGWIASPWQRVIGASYEHPSLKSIAHLFGTDIFGRSVLYKAIYGCRIAVTVGLFSTSIAILLGITLGAIAGYFGGWIDEWIVWFYTTVSSIPSMMLLLAIAYVMEKGVLTVCIAIGFTSWVGLCRVIRGEVLKHKNREYVLAARSLGVSHFGCLFKHILPNVFHQVIISFSLLFQSAIKSEVILSYLGIGVQNQPSWGIMIDDAKLELARGMWWQLVAATFFMFFLVLALNVFGDALRDALDPKLKS